MDYIELTAEELAELVGELLEQEIPALGEVVPETICETVATRAAEAVVVRTIDKVWHYGWKTFKYTVGTSLTCGILRQIYVWSKMDTDLRKYCEGRFGYPAKGSVEVFCPLDVAGISGSVTWTRENGYLLRREQGARKRTQPIAVEPHTTTRPRWYGRDRADVYASRTNNMYVEFNCVSTRETWWHIWFNDEVESLGDRRLHTDRTGQWYQRKEFYDGDVIYTFMKEGETRCQRLTEQEFTACQNYAGSQQIQAYNPSSVLKNLNPQKWKGALITEVAAAFAAFSNAGKENIKLQQPALKQLLQLVGDRRDDIMAPWKPTGRLVGPMLVSDEDGTPTVGRQSGIVAVDARLDKPRPEVDIPSIYREYAYDFVEETYRCVGELTPYSLEQVLEHQDGVLQKKRNEKAKWWIFSPRFFPGLGDTKVEAMTKKEPSPDMGPARNISTLRPEYNLQLSRYTLALSKRLKETVHWYTPGRTPEAIAESVVATVRAQDEVAAADVSKMDSCKTPALTVMLHIAMAKRVSPEYDTDFVSLLESEVLSTGRTSEGEPYAIGGSQLSGSATTTLHNTVCNAFMNYCALRKAGFSHKDAWDEPGAFVGDDSVSRCVHKDKAGVPYIETVASDLGYVIKLETIKHGEEVPFLSRNFPHACIGGLGSYQDPMRLMRKSHISYSPPEITDQQAAVNKWRGYHELDPANSAYLALYNAARRVTGLEGDITTTDTPYILQIAEGGGGWPQLDNCDDYFTAKTGCDVGVIIEWANSVCSWQDWLSAPRMIETPKKARKHELTIVVNDPTTIAPVEHVFAGRLCHFDEPNLCGGEPSSSRHC